MKGINKILLGILSVVLFACEGKFEPIGDNGLTAAELKSPADKEVCLEGTFLETGKIEIPFAWNEVVGATGYRLEVENQTSKSIDVFETTSLGANLSLEPGTLYIWQVYALQGNAEKKSESWSFYSEGFDIPNYAPFPATVNVLDQGNGNVQISWQGSDKDNDIENYDVLLSPENPPLLLVENTTQTSVSETLSQNVTYYLHVVTKDKLGNSSTSKVSFTVR